MTTPRTIEPAQRTAAKVVGFLYLFAMATSIVAFALRGQAIVAGDATQTAHNIVASELLFRISMVIDLITFACDVALATALYVILKPIHRSAALLALLWRMIESAVLVVATLSCFGALLLVHGDTYLRVFEPQQLAAVVYSFIRIYGAGFRIGFLFLGLGSALFGYLWLRSRYIPRGLALLGILASLAMALVNIAAMLFPSFGATVSVVYYAPMFVFEVALGIWLLAAGLREPAVVASSSG